MIPAPFRRLPVVKNSLLTFSCFALGMMLGATVALSAEKTAETGIPWETQLPAFRSDAPLTESPLILYFTASWCGFCKQMERTTLADPAVDAALAGVSHVKLDFDAQAELAGRYHVTGVPAFVAVNERGEEVSRAIGAMGSFTFLRWLEGSKKRAAEVIALTEKAKAERTWLTEQLTTGDPETKNAVREKLFDLLGRGDPASRDFAQQVLTIQSQVDRTVWLAGLQRPDLAVRIAAANLLRAQLQHDFAFDPWASEEDRRLALTRLREALGRERVNR